MIERRVIDKTALMDKLNSMTYEYLDELQLKHLLNTLGRTIEIEEEGDAECNTD